MARPPRVVSTLHLLKLLQSPKLPRHTCEEKSMPDRPITAGERLADVGSFSQRGGDGPNLWRTLGFRRTEWGAGFSVVEWEATPDYGFVTPNGHVIQGGLVTAILDSAMGGA